MAAELNEMFEQAAGECENLTEEADSLLGNIGDLIDRAGILGDRVEMEGEKASKNLDELSDKLQEAEQALEDKAASTRSQMETLQKKAEDVEDKVEEMLASVEKAMKELEEKKSQLLSAVNTAQDKAEDELEKFADQIKELEEAAEKQLEEAEEAAKEKGVRRFVTVQNEYSLLAREAREEVLPACRRLDLSFMPYFPLASGLLTGKYRKGQPPPPGSRLAGPGGWDEFMTDERLDLVERLMAFAEQRGHTILELAMSWLASQPEIATVIAGATTAEQVRANADALEAWRLSDDELAEIDDLLGDEGSPR
jgi:diketogulonate reductase-like aldo/keto reductase